MAQSSFLRGKLIRHHGAVLGKLQERGAVKFYICVDKYLKGQCHEIFDHFFICLKDSTWAPYEQAKTVSRTFRFREDIRSQSSKNRCQRSQGLRGHPNFSLDMAVFKFFQIIAIGCVNIPKYIFLPDCSFKIFEKPSKFSKSVRVVIDVSA